jgi:hypothetical protein
MTTIAFAGMTTMIGFPRNDKHDRLRRNDERCPRHGASHVHRRYGLACHRSVVFPAHFLSTRDAPSLCNGAG